LVWLFLSLALISPAQALPSLPGDGPPDPHRTEVTVFPSMGFSTDLGLGLGALGVIARFHPDHEPFRWRLAFQGNVHVNTKPGGGLTATHTDDYLQLELPGLAGGRLRLRLLAAFRLHGNAGYYGMGNASVEERPWEAIDEDADPDGFQRAIRFHQYSRTYPTLRADVWLDLPRPFRLFAGGSLVWNWIQVYEGSRLELDLADDSGDSAADLLVGARRHGVLEGYAGVMLDTRDHEFAPTRGWFADLSVRGGPLLEIPGGYVGLNGAVRAYRRIWGPYLVVAARLMGDVLLGTPPFYELSHFGGLYPDHGPGGGRSLRGAPQMRYHGKVKLIANLELRSTLVSFRLLRLPSSLGVTFFGDTGRVWADTRPRPELDRAAGALKYGLGGGLRLRMGETFVVRGDYGWSPDGWGIYLDVDHVF